MKNARLATLAIVCAAFAMFALRAQDAPANEASAPAAEPRLPPKETFNRIFEPCAHCHEIGEGARSSAGPVLTGIIGRKVASEKYPYSRAMRSSGLVWDKATLSRFIANPNEVVPGTRMLFGGLPQDKIAPLVDYIASIK